MKTKISLIGISSQSSADRYYASKFLSERLGYFLADFDQPIYNLLEDATGITPEDAGKTDMMNAYLGREWSYVREEKFSEEGNIVFKPVRYYLTAKQIFNKLKYDLRNIHPDFWVNIFFKMYCPPFTVLPVRYPNQADAIQANGGIVLRINNSSYSAPILKEDTLMDGFTCDHTFSVTNETLIKTLINFVCQQEKENPSVFTSK